MSDADLPSDYEGEARQPEVRLELTRAGVQEVLSLYSQEQRDGADEPTFSFSLEDLESAVRERRQMLLYGLGGGIAFALLVLLFSTSLYPVSAQVVLERHDVARAESSAQGALPGSSFVATQAEVMQSESVIAAAVEALPMARHLDEDDDGVADALERVRVSPISGTQILALGYLGPDAEHGVALLTQIVDAYRDALAQNEAAIQREKLRAKQAEIDVLESEADVLEARLVEMRRAKGIYGSADDASAAHSNTVRDLAAQLAEVRNERIMLENRLAAGGDQVALLDPSIRSLQEQLWAAEAELARVRLTLKSRHPAVEAAQQEVTVLTQQLERSSKAAPEALARDIQASKGLEAQLSALHDEERATMAAIERDRREETLLLAEVERVRAMSDQRRNELLDQRLLTRLAETGETGVSARMIEPPTMPSGRSWPKPKLILPLGAITGVLVALVCAIVSLRRERAAAETLARGEQWVPPGRGGAPSVRRADDRVGRKRA